MKDEQRWTDATDPEHVRGLARELGAWNRANRIVPVIVAGMLDKVTDSAPDVPWDGSHPDADLGGELVDLGLMLASNADEGKLPKPVPGYLDVIPGDDTAASTGCQLHDAGVRRCIAAEWSFRAIVSGTEVLPGKVAVISDTERARTGTPALWRVTISLPWWVLASVEERARGIAHLLAMCGWDATRGANVRRPDFSGFAHVIHKHGIAETKANARALAEVAASKVLVDMLQRHYPKGSQGLLFADTKVIEGES